MIDAAAFEKAVARKDLGKIQDIFREVIDSSFTAIPVRHRTFAEERHRGQIVLRWFRKLRYEKGWSVDRALGILEHALSAELLGLKYEPDDRTMFAVNEKVDQALGATLH